MPRKSPCKWISRDETGRPSCVHGPAYPSGRHWRCAGKERERNLVTNMNKAALKRKYEQERELRKRRVRMKVGGIAFHLGYAPTVEAATYLKAKIRTEAP